MIKSLASFVYIVTRLMALVFASLPKATSHLYLYLLLSITNQSPSPINSLPYTSLKSVPVCPVIVLCHASIISSRQQPLGLTIPTVHPLPLKPSVTSHHTQDGAQTSQDDQKAPAPLSTSSLTHLLTLRSTLKSHVPSHPPLPNHDISYAACLHGY